MTDSNSWINLWMRIVWTHLIERQSAKWAQRWKTDWCNHNGTLQWYRVSWYSLEPRAFVIFAVAHFSHRSNSLIWISVSVNCIQRTNKHDVPIEKSFCRWTNAINVWGLIYNFDNYWIQTSNCYSFKPKQEQNTQTRNTKRNHHMKWIHAICKQSKFKMKYK